MNGKSRVALCLLFVVLGCGKEEVPPRSESGSAAPATQAATSAEPAAAEPAAGLTTVIAAGESEIPGVRAEIHSLDRGTAGILTLEFSLINKGEEDLAFDYTFTDPSHSVADFGGIGGVYLIDATGREKISVMRDADNRCICSRKLDSIGTGGRARLWAKFQGPSGEVGRVSMVIPKFLPIDEVPIGSTPAPPSGSPTVLASAAGEIPGQRVEIRKLARGSGDIVDLRLTIINDSDQPIGFGYDFVDPNQEVPDFNSIGGVYLLDPMAREKHGVIRDPENKCVCSQGIKDLEKGQKVELWAKLTAPPASTDRLSVVVPHFLPMDDVPLE
jgi:hypothetical protein